MRMNVYRDKLYRRRKNDELNIRYSKIRKFDLKLGNKERHTLYVSECNIERNFFYFYVGYNLLDCNISIYAKGESYAFE